MTAAREMMSAVTVTVGPKDLKPSYSATYRAEPCTRCGYRYYDLITFPKAGGAKHEFDRMLRCLKCAWVQRWQNCATILV